MIDVALLDDHAILREGIKYLLAAEPDIRVCAECERPSQIDAVLARNAPQVLVLDLNMPEGGGFPLLERIRPSYPDLRILVLSTHDNNAFITKALAYGCDGYVTKTRAIEELALSIRSVMTGNRYLSSDLSRSRQGGHTALSAREREVLKGLIQGRNPKALAVELGITDKTLYAHRSNIMQKLQARSLPELHAIALNNDLI